MVTPLRLRRARDVYVFRCNLPPALLTELPGFVVGGVSVFVSEQLQTVAQNIYH